MMKKRIVSKKMAKTTLALKPGGSVKIGKETLVFEPSGSVWVREEDNRLSHWIIFVWGIVVGQMLMLGIYFSLTKWR